MNNALLCYALFAGVTLFSLFNVHKLHSPDVKSFLLMDRLQNLSDASEDEDDKVSNQSIIVFLFCWISLFCSSFVCILSVYMLNGPHGVK